MIQFSRNDGFHLFPHRIQLFIRTTEKAFGEISFIFQSIGQNPHICMHNTAICFYLWGHFFRQKGTVVIEIDFPLLPLLLPPQGAGRQKKKNVSAPFPYSPKLYTAAPFWQMT